MYQFYHLSFVWLAGGLDLCLLTDVTRKAGARMVPVLFRCNMEDKKNLCAVLHGAGDLRVEERAIPRPSDGEVQIAVRSVGLCGSDIALYRTGRVGLFPLQRPIVLGHEPCGIVSEVGPGVTDLTVGDRVALSPNRDCGTCSPCQEGRGNLCPHAQMMATPPTSGSLAHFVVWPARLCFKMPPEMTWVEGAFVQPMALAVYGVQRAGVKPGHRVLVCGAGPLGMMMVVAAKASGATRICVTDITEDRLQFLSDVCGCSTLRADDGSPRDVADRVTSLLGRSADVTMECSGAASAVSTAIYATKPGGCILLAGIGPPEVQIPLLAAASKEVDIRSMFRFTNTYPAAIDLMASGQVDVTSLVTHTFDLCDVVEAFDAMNKGARGKIIIKCSDD